MKLKVLLAVMLLAGVGYAQVIPAITAECATSTDGSVVGVPNPLSPPLVSPGFSGTLPAGNYFVVYTWYDAANHVTLASPELLVQLTATGNLVVNPPASGAPASAVGMQVFIGTTSGSETLQGSVIGSAAYTQSTPLVTGTGLPVVNTTVCQVVANDAGWPTGTGYNVTATSPAGDTLPGYPSQWQLLGPGNTINLSQGLPLYNGVVQYPSPILAVPYGHGPQSISGPLSLGNYPLTAGNISAKSINGTAQISVSNSYGWAGGDVGAWINSAIASIGCGDVYIAAGNYNQSTSAIVPRCIHVRGSSAMGTRITWVPSSGWQFILADNTPNLDDNYSYEGAIEDLTLVGPGVTNTAGAFYFGGSDGATNSPSTLIDPQANFGDHFNINRVRIIRPPSLNGFNVCMQWGSNAWSNTIFQSVVSFCGTGLYFPATITNLNSGEEISVVNSSVSNNTGVGVLVGNVSGANAINVSITNSSLDFNGSWAVQNGTVSNSNSVSMMSDAIYSPSNWIQNYGLFTIEGAYFTGGQNSGVLGYLIDNENQGFTSLGGQYLNGGSGTMVNVSGVGGTWISPFTGGGQAPVIYQSYLSEFGNLNNNTTTSNVLVSNVIEQSSANTLAGTTSCSGNTKTFTWGLTYNSQPVILIFDETTAGGANLTSKNTHGATVHCTGATDIFDWMVIGNPN